MPLNDANIPEVQKTGDTMLYCPVVCTGTGYPLEKRVDSVHCSLRGEYFSLVCVHNRRPGSVQQYTSKHALAFWLSRVQYVYLGGRSHSTRVFKHR